MDFRTVVAVSGMVVGLALLLIGRKNRWAIELRLAGAFLLASSFAYLMGIPAPKLW
jgi:hypothetical protein